MAQSRSDEQLANFVHNIVTLRRAHGLSKRAMAKILHISLYSLNQMGNGHFPPHLGVEALVFAAIHFRIPAHELLSRRLG